VHGELLNVAVCSDPHSGDVWVDGPDPDH
jgi:hypothetical protein